MKGVDNIKTKKIIEAFENYSYSKSLELFGYPDTDLSPEEYDKLNQYMFDLAYPKWETIVIADDGTKCQISNTGDIRDVNVKHIKAYYNNSNYRTVWIRSKSNPKTCYPRLVHRLVATAFVPNPDNKPEVDHLNNNTSINWWGNLIWVTHQENIDHAIKSGNQVVGINHANAKWTEDQIRKVCEMLENPDVILQDIAKATGVSIKTINHIRFNGGWKYISKDYNINVPVRNPGPRYSPLSLSIRDKILAGKTNDEIKAELNTPELRYGASMKTISDRIWYIRTKLL